ncbi:Laccase-6 [Hibiscus syriacus]|uniref:Laccase-6 n=1 Tax=Hibiscus syriacus TaxID=106335 RepID=A0A6A3ADQ2_HIBSY|nr:Laccase-6 [Hibiscus syriacus]
MFPGPVVYAQEDARIVVKVTNETPYNATIHWHGVRQKLSCWFDGPSYITQRPIQAGQSFTYEFTMVKQKGVPSPFKHPYEEHIVILGSSSKWRPSPLADAFTINGNPVLATTVLEMMSTRSMLYQGRHLLRLINAGLNMENFFDIANHKLTIVEADAEYTNPFTTDRVMPGPGQTMNVLVTANQPVGKHSISMGRYMSAKNISFQHISATAYFQYFGAVPNSVSLSAKLPNFNDNLAVKTVMDGLRSLNPTPQKNCSGMNNGTFAASMNNISFLKPTISILEAYYKKIGGQFTVDFPGVWFTHCHLDIHQSRGLGAVLIVRKGEPETLPHPPADLPRC